MSRSERIALVLAAGKGTRMKSERPKVAHEVAGRPMIVWAVATALDAGADRVVVVLGHGREEVSSLLRATFDTRVESVLQEEQRGTGHAVKVALEALPPGARTVGILYGDCPLIRPDTVRALFDARDESGAKVALVTAELASPSGYGRILRDAGGNVRAIREERDCTPEERAVREVNPGLYAIDDAFLRGAIASLGTDNAQGELYLTDVVERAAAEGRVADVVGDMDELRGVNDRLDLALADRAMRLRIAESLARSGVGLRDPALVFVDASAVVEPDAFLEAGVHLRGKTIVRRGARIDVGAILEDVEVDAEAHVLPYTVASRSRIGERAHVGPFTHLRPETVLLADSKVGNFCETKKTRVGLRSKVNHLAYVGDGEIGDDVNVGAGTIFCNYDGVNKHTTVLEDGVFIGSDSQLVAPVRVGRGAYVASGTTVTRDVPPDALALSRTKQENKEGFGARLRARKKKT